MTHRLSALQQPIELFNGPCPERLLVRDPLFGLLKRLLAQPKPMYTSFNRPLDETGLL
jgi:hypothetical protein